MLSFYESKYSKNNQNKRRVYYFATYFNQVLLLILVDQKLFIRFHIFFHHDILQCYLFYEIKFVFNEDICSSKKESCDFLPRNLIFKLLFFYFPLK